MLSTPGLRLLTPGYESERRLFADGSRKRKPIDCCCFGFFGYIQIYRDHPEVTKVGQSGGGAVSD